MAPAPRPIFISHATPDEAWARWIAATLDAAGLPTELAVRDWPAGSDFTQSMDRALKQARMTLVVLSPRFEAARYTAPELAAALRADPAGVGGTLLPVRVEGVDLAGMLAGRVFVDLVGLPEAAAAAELLRRVRHALEGGRLDTPVVFPGGAGGGADTATRSPDAGTPAPFPGALPPLWTIGAPAAGFVGRVEELAQLDAAGRGVVALTQALTGLGGVGKTTLARQWACSRAAGFSLGWWVRAESPTLAEEDLVALAQALGLAAPGGDRGAALAAVHTWLHAPTPRPHVPHPERPWLLVYDNAGDRASLPLPTGPGRVVVTSRDRAWVRGARAVPVGTLPPDDCVALLQEGLTGAGNTEADAQALAEALGHLPLALAQARAWCLDQGVSLARCRQRLGEGSPVLRYPAGTGEATVSGTWALLVEVLRPPARLLLELLACFGPEEIPVEALFAAAPDEVPPEVAALCGEGLDEALGALHRVHLAERRGERAQVHRLVQRVVREGLSEEQRTARREAAGRLLRRAMPHPAEPKGWTLWRLLGPHVERVAVGEGVLEARALGEYAFFLFTQAEYGRSLALQERALRITEAALGPDRPSVGTRLGNLAETLSALGRHAEAQPLKERALRITEAALGPDHPDVGIRLDNLASTLSALGRHAEARPLEERALRITEAALGPDHPQVGIRLGNLASTLSALGRHAEALPLAERALRITEAALGPDHPDVGLRLGNLASTLSALGQYAEARPLEERALRITEAALGHEHPDAGLRLGNLAVTEWELGLREEARVRMARAVEVFTRALGEDHPRTRHFAAQLRQMGG